MFVLSLLSDGSVAGAVKISNNDGGLAGAGVVLGSGSEFGNRLESIGDLDGDNVPDLAVFAPGVGDGGALFILFLESDGSVRAASNISTSAAAFTDAGFMVDAGDEFGSSLAGLGDVDADGVPDLAVGAPTDDDGGTNSGAVYILLMTATGGVKEVKKISRTAGGLVEAGASLDSFDYFGSSLQSLGDINRDGVVDLLVGASGIDDLNDRVGGAFVLFLDNSLTVWATQRLSGTSGGLQSVGVPFQPVMELGRSVGVVGDVDADGMVDAVIASYRFNDGGTDSGGIIVVNFNSTECAPPTSVREASKSGRESKRERELGGLAAACVCVCARARGAPGPESGRRPLLQLSLWCG